MKTRATLLILSTTLICMVIAGCNKSHDITGTTKPNSTVKAEIKDSEVTTSVKTALLSDAEVKNFDIAVVTLKGDVRLTGVVDSQSQIDHMEKLVRSIEGVHSIHDELSVKK